jgi:hypothetical protein
MHRHDPASARHEVKCLRDELCAVRGRLFGLERLEDEMEMVCVQRQIRPFGLRSEASDERLSEPDRGADRLEILGGPPLQVDPEEAPLPEIVQ